MKLISTVILLLPFIAAAQTGTWISKESLPTARQEMPSILVNGKIYTIGGIASNASILNTNEAYTVSSNTWVSLASAPVPRHHQALASVGENIFMLGGYSNLTFSATPENFIYNTLSNQWDTIAPLPAPLGGSCSYHMEPQNFRFWWRK